MLRFFQQHTYLLIVPILSVMVPAIVWTHEGPTQQYPTIELTVWADSTGQTDSTASYMVPVIEVSAWEATRASMSLIKNEGQMIPFRPQADRPFVLLSVGQSVPQFYHNLQHYVPVELHEVDELQDTRFAKIPKEAAIIVAINRSPLNEYALKHFFHKLSPRGPISVVNFAGTDLLSRLLGSSVLLQAPNASSLSQKIAAQILFGGLPVNGGLPAPLMSQLKIDTLYETQSVRLAYTDPEYLGVSADSLKKIDQIIEEAIASYAMPGCQVLVAKEGHVIYEKAFGYHTYRKKRPVQKDDLYDLASVTKIAATTLATMKMYEEGQLVLDDPLSRFFQDPSYVSQGYKRYDTLNAVAFAELRNRWRIDSVETEKDTLRYADSLFLVGTWINEGRFQRESRVFDLPLRDLLTHTSGLQASLPIEDYKRRQDNKLFHFASDQQYSVPVAENLYLNQTWMDSLWNLTKGLPVADTARYRYSCVNMILMQRVIDSLNQRSIAEYLQESFYQGLGLRTMGYNPRERFPTKRLVPTAKDPWRKQVLCGTVHDPTAALLGGISGNAGLFSNANDLAVLAQMWLNGGEYGGERFLKDSTIQRFSMRQKGHRGYGFDKPPRHHNYYVAPSASLETYGHTGFTGTCVWVDPEHELVYVFLSNRVHPDEKNYKINELQVRRRVHQVIYDLMKVPMRKVPRRPQNDPLPVMAENDAETSPKTSATLFAP
jgi:CubicO group peptidase (beta-lactamase class C family)